LLLIYAFVRRLRGVVTATPYFASAFATLLLCCLTVIGLRSQTEVIGYSLNLPDAPGEIKLASPQNLDKAHRAPLLTAVDARTPLPRTLAFVGGTKNPEWDRSQQPGLLRYREEGDRNVVKAAPLNQVHVMSVGLSPLPKGKDILPFTVRVYAHVHAAEKKDIEPPETIFWHPLLLARDGAAEVTFDLPSKPASYRIRIEGNSSSGRLGAVQKNVEAHP
jgi:hypothetical protein